MAGFFGRALSQGLRRDEEALPQESQNYDPDELKKALVRMGVSFPIEMPTAILAGSRPREYSPAGTLISKLRSGAINLGWPEENTNPEKERYGFAREQAPAGIEPDPLNPEYNKFLSERDKFDAMNVNFPGAPGGKSLADLLRGAKSAGFFSALERSVQNLPQKVATADQWAGMIRNLKGVKADEIKFTGVLDYLADPQVAGRKVTKEEILKHLSENRLGVRIKRFAPDSDPTQTVPTPDRRYPAEVISQDLSANGFQPGPLTAPIHQLIEDYADPVGTDKLVQELRKKAQANRSTAKLLELLTGPGQDSILLAAQAEEIEKAAAHIERKFPAGYVHPPGSAVRTPIEEGGGLQYEGYNQYWLEDAQPNSKSERLYFPTRAGRTVETDYDPAHFRGTGDSNFIAHDRRAVHTDAEGRPIQVTEEDQSDFFQKSTGFKDPETESKYQALVGKIGEEEKARAAVRSDSVSAILAALRRQLGSQLTDPNTRSIQFAPEDFTQFPKDLTEVLESKARDAKGRIADQDLRTMVEDMLGSTRGNPPEVIAQSQEAIDLLAQKLREFARIERAQAGMELERGLLDEGLRKDMPFKRGAWIDLLSKQQLMDAIDQGSNKIYWTTAAQQKIRTGQGQLGQVKRLIWAGDPESGAGYLRVLGENGSYLGEHQFDSWYAMKRQIGKELADMVRGGTPVNVHDMPIADPNIDTVSRLLRRSRENMSASPNWPLEARVVDDPVGSYRGLGHDRGYDQEKPAALKKLGATVKKETIDVPPADAKRAEFTSDLTPDAYVDTEDGLKFRNPATGRLKKVDQPVYLERHEKIVQHLMKHDRELAVNQGFKKSDKYRIASKYDGDGNKTFRILRNEDDTELKGGFPDKLSAYIEARQLDGYWAPISGNMTPKELWSAEAPYDLVKQIIEKGFPILSIPLLLQMLREGKMDPNMVPAQEGPYGAGNGEQ